MATTRNIKGLVYSDYEYLLRSEDILQDLGYSTAHRMLHSIIDEIDSEIEMVFFNVPELRKLADTIEEAARDFRHIVVQLNDFSIYDFAWFGTSMAKLVLSNQSGWNRVFIWQVKEVIVGEQMEKGEYYEEMK